MNIEISIGGPLADAINNLAAALQTSGLIDRAQAASEPKSPRKAKPAEPVAPAPVAQIDEPPISAAEAKTPEVQEATAPTIDKKALQVLANAKSGKVGAERVKEVIQQFGGKNINSTPPEKLAELMTALEGL